jgi:PAS domain S-box-containing protein
MPINIECVFDELQIAESEKTNTLLGYWDDNLICRYANKAYLYWFGVHPSRMIDKMHIKELLGSLYELNLPYIEDAVNGIECVFYSDVSLPDGSIKQSRANYIPQIENGKVKGFLVKVADISRVTRATIIDKLNISAGTDKYLLTQKNVLDDVVETLKASIFHDFPGIPLLAKKHYLSESKLKRDFKERFTETIFSYYRNLQMEVAHEFIVSKKANKSQMAHLLNFANPSNFSSCYQNYLNNRLPKQIIDNAVAENDQKYRAIIDQTPLPIAVLDNELRFLKASEGFIIEHQLQNEDYIGECIYYIWPESKDLYQEKLKKCLTGEISRSDGAWLEKADGELCLRSWDIRPWHDISGSISGVLIYSEPVTIECLQKEAYKTMNALLNKTQQLVRIGTWESDFVNHITTWSPVLKEIMEVPENFDPTLEDTLVFFKDDATREMIIKLRKDSMESGIPFDIEVYMVTAKGKTIRVRALGQTEFVNGRYVKAYGVFQDITKMS